MRPALADHLDRSARLLDERRQRRRGAEVPGPVAAPVAPPTRPGRPSRDVGGRAEELWEFLLLVAPGDRWRGRAG
jgi:hypothetical protein